MKNIYILIWGLFFFGNGFAQSGQLDSTFGGNGLVSTPVALTGYSYARNVIPLSSGGYLATGYGFDGTSYAMTLIRYLNDGTQDALFGTFGKVTLSYNGLSTYGYNSTLQPDGKILVCGDYFDGISYTFCVARFLDNGSPDSSFGSNGIATFALGSGTHGNIGYSVGLQSNGKIIVSGGNYNGANYDYAAIRFKDNGTIDSSFGTNGATTIAVGTGNDNCYSMVIQDDDKIVLCGDYQNGSNYIFSIVRLNSNGSIDTNFGSNGISIQAVGSVDDDYGYTVLMQGNKILFGGTSKNSNGYDFTLGRLDSLGNLDSGFGSSGFAYADFSSSHPDDYGRSAFLQSDGKILLAGKSQVIGSCAALARFESNGLPDVSFGTNGMAYVQLASTAHEIYSAAMDVNDKIVISGHLSTGSPDNFILARFHSGINSFIVVPQSEKSFSVFPNPSCNKVNIRISEPSLFGEFISLYNSDGKLIRSFIAGIDYNEISIADLPAGIYYLISGKQKIKLVKE